MSDHTKDRAVLDAATQGEWEAEYDGDCYMFHGGVIRVDVCYEEATTDATHIAHFDPPKVRALLNEIAGLEARATKAEDTVRALACNPHQELLAQLVVVERERDEARADLAEARAIAVRSEARFLLGSAFSSARRKEDAATIAKWSKL